MNRRPFQLGPRLRSGFYLAFALLFASGLAWWVADEAQEEARSPVAWAERLKPGMLRIHAAAAYAFLILLGGVWVSHASRAWAAGINRVAGVFLGLALGLQVLTGYGLEHFPVDWIRERTGTFHISAGLLIPAWVAVHVLWGRRLARRRFAGNP